MMISSCVSAFVLASCLLLQCPKAVFSILVEETPTDDAMVRGGNFESTNFGASGSFMVKEKKSWVNNEDLNRRSFVKFDISGIQGTIATASVRLFVKGVQSQSKVSLCPVTLTEQWSESTITWLNQPSYGESLGDEDIPAKGQYVEWDVSAHLQLLVDIGETVLSLALDGSPVIDQYATFASKETSNEAEWPKLIVDFDDTVATTTTDEPIITTTAEPDTTTTTTVDLSAFPSVTPTNMPSSKPSGTPSLAPSAKPTPSGTSSLAPAAEPTPPVVQQCATAIEDTYIREDRADNNYSGDDRLDTKAVQGDIRRSFVKFDVSGITSPVTSAVLRLFCYTEGLFASVETSIYALDTNSWDASQVTWNNQQASMTGPALATEDSPEVRGESVDLDLTPYINSNIGATELSFAIVAESGESVYKYYSMDAVEGLKPLLVIDSLAKCPDPPTSGPPTSGLVPFDLAKFQPVLNNARLQYPESSPTAVSAGQFAGYSSDGFQLVDDQYIQFHISSSEGARSELRHESEFASGHAVERSIQARMKIPQPDASLVSQFTFLQVHTKEFLGNPSGPLLRVVWFNTRNGNNDWLWANIRKSLNPKTNEYFPLQARPNDFFDIKVRVVNSTLSILIDGSYPNPVYNAYDLSYWDPIQTNYFKAGAYLNSGSTGPVVTLFDELTFTV